MTASVRKFRAVPESVPAARRFVRDTLHDQSREVIQAAELMTSELATNCIQHAHTDFELAIDMRDRIRVEVRDTNKGEPKVQFPRPEDQSGRGLRIVEAMSDTWGVIPSQKGKIVWFALEVQRASAGDTQKAAVGGERQSERDTRGGRLQGVPVAERSSGGMGGRPRGQRTRVRS